MVLPGANSDYAKKMAVLMAAAFVLRLVLVHVHPFYLDEALYTEMMGEQVQHPSVIPTYLGFPTSWKPAFFFWVYPLFSQPLLALGADIELAYRLPNVVFGTLNVLLVFLIFRRLAGGKTAFFISVLYAFCPLVVYTDLRVLLDTMNATLIFGSIYFYLEGGIGENMGNTGADMPGKGDARESGKKNAAGLDWKNIALGTLLAFLAALTKTTVALLIPLVVLGFCMNRKGLGKRLLFLVPLAAALAGIVLVYIALFAFAPHLAGGEFGVDIASKFSPGTMDYLDRGQRSTESVFGLVHILLIFSFLGFLKLWREDLGMALWAAAIAFPLLASYGMAWYFYPLIPALAYFSVRWLGHDQQGGSEKYDELFLLMMGLIVLLDLAAIGIWYGAVPGDSFFQEERAIGLSLVGKSAAFVGDYYGSVTALTYKNLEERRIYGNYTEFGWAIVPHTQPMPDRISQVGEFANNYSSTKYKVNEDNFAELFWNFTLFRKPSAKTSFDYVVVIINNPDGGTGWKNNVSINGYHKIKDGESSEVFQRN